MLAYYNEFEPTMATSTSYDFYCCASEEGPSFEREGSGFCWWFGVFLMPRLWMAEKSTWSRVKWGWEKADTTPLSVLHLLNPYILSWRTKDANLECLKNVGRTSDSSLGTEITQMEVPVRSQRMMEAKSSLSIICMSLRMKVATLDFFYLTYIS